MTGPDRSGGAARQAAPGRIAPVSVTAHGLASAAGVGLPALARVLAADASALTPHAGHRRTAAGPGSARVPGLDDSPLPAAWSDWDCRATRLAWLGLQADGCIEAVMAARQRQWRGARGPGAGHVGIDHRCFRTRLPAPRARRRLPARALRHPALHTLHGLGAFVQRALRLEGPGLTVSTACSSSAKACAVAERWLRLGPGRRGGGGRRGRARRQPALWLQCAAAGIARTLPALRHWPPRHQRRGEAAGYLLLERGPGALQLAGYGESNDAHHMSSPAPAGPGRRACAGRRAGARRPAGLRHRLPQPARHRQRTQRRGRGRAGGAALRPPGLHASATKGATGHTMGAAGLVEALVCLLALRDGLCAGSPGTQGRRSGAGRRLRRPAAAAAGGAARCAMRPAIRSDSAATTSVLVFGAG